MRNKGIYGSLGLCAKQPQLPLLRSKALERLEHGFHRQDVRLGLVRVELPGRNKLGLHLRA